MKNVLDSLTTENVLDSLTAEKVFFDFHKALWKKLVGYEFEGSNFDPLLEDYFSGVLIRCYQNS